MKQTNGHPSTLSTFANAGREMKRLVGVFSVVKESAGPATVVSWREVGVTV